MKVIIRSSGENRSIKNINNCYTTQNIDIFPTRYKVNSENMQSLIYTLDIKLFGESPGSCSVLSVFCTLTWSKQRLDR